MIDEDAMRELQEANDARAKVWRFRANFVHDYDLPRDTWMVDGVVQATPLTEASLFAAINREGDKPTVAVGAPLHLVLARITGRQPPYKTT